MQDLTPSSPSPSSVDVLVLGAGIGGLCAAARLAHGGYSTLLIEALGRVGGRASTEEIEGFHINTGAIAIERGGVLEETFASVGAPLELRIPVPAATFRIAGRALDPSRGGWKLLLGGLGGPAARLLEKMAAARSGELPEGALTTKEWLDRLTSSETVHAIFRNLSAAIFAANADELPARVFLTYFMRKGAFRKFGFAPRGTIGPCRELARVVERSGEVWLESPVERILIAEGGAAGAIIRRRGRTVEVRCRQLVSNLGPRATVALAGEAHFDAGYLDQVRKVLRPAANIVVNFASREPLLDQPGIVTFGPTRRLCNMANLTATCPELAPPGWHLYVAYAVPVPALGDFDAEHETALALKDLRDQLPGFDQARILSLRVMRGEWPAQRSCAGFDLPQATPIANLWNVGDGVKEYGEGGLEACAESAKRVVAAIERAAPPGAGMAGD